MSSAKIRCKYSATSPRPVQSFGKAELFLPIVFLIDWLTARLAEQGLQCLEIPLDDESFQKALDRAGMGKDDGELLASLQQLSVPEVEWDGTQKGLRSLGVMAEQLSTGAMEEDSLADEHKELSVAAHGQLLTGIRRGVQELDQTSGVTAAIEGLHRFKDQLRAKMQSLLAKRKSLPRPLVNDLRNASKRLKRFSRLKEATVAWLINLIWKDTPLGHWIPGDWNRRIERDLSVINQARRFLQDQAGINSQLKLLEQILGNAHSIGELGPEMLHLEAQLQKRQSLQELVAPDHSKVEPACSTQLLVVSSPDEILDRETGATFETVAFRLIARVGCTPQQLAESWRKHGLVVSRRRHKPYEFSQCDVAEVREAVIADTKRFLGIVDEEWNANPQHPRTGLDLLAGLSLHSPELQARTKELIGSLVGCSSPYAGFRRLDDGQILQEAFLYCHPTERGVWRELLEGQITITDPHEEEAYSLYGRYRVLLIQKTLIAPVGNLKSAWRWSAASNRVRRAGRIAPLVDRERLIDFRRLDRRVKDHRDCVQFFDAGRAEGSIFEIGTTGDRFAFRGTDEETKWLFHEMVVSPRWLTGQDFLALTGQTTFVAILQTLFPELPSLAEVCHRLSRETEPEAVMNRLVSMGLCASESGRFRLTRSPERLRDPWLSRVFEVTLGDLIGLSRESFVSKLQDDDPLYNALYWIVFDAHLQGRISRNETPDSVAKFIEELKH